MTKLLSLVLAATLGLKFSLTVRRRLDRIPPVASSDDGFGLLTQTIYADWGLKKWSLFQLCQPEMTHAELASSGRPRAEVTSSSG